MSNLKIRVKHFRQLLPNGTVDNMGGITLAAEVDENNKVVNYAMAMCHSNDNFSKKLGHVKAVGRLKSPAWSANTVPVFDENDNHVGDLETDWQRLCERVTEEFNVYSKQGEKGKFVPDGNEVGRFVWVEAA